MKATRLTLMCHARTVAQKLARFPTNEPLEMDWQSARASRSSQFKGAPKLLCGPELRTRQTAELFGSTMEVVAALRDCDFGRWCGASINDVQTSEPELLQGWIADPHAAPHGGESVAQVCRRTAEWLTTLQATPGHFIAVTHPFVIRAALSHVLQSPAYNLIDVEPLSSIELRFNGCWRLRLPGTDPEGVS
ncbi:histidine phosphatase family protein [Pseudomonas sp. Sample_10]|uniref:histidine phosphatase family protein n=1 Tax=Pseudomonas sp. Sample_10 TaxID=2448269 RepID=UPI001036C9B3|nr:histidine phosphatase family protein [Pseudomonas sp. Sample_10]